jgi:hypothetical protein
VLHRLMVSGSDRHVHDWRQRLRIPGAEALRLKQAYKAMAWLGETTSDDRPMTELIEEALYRHRQPLFGERSVAFFDTTSLYFEGRGGATLGQRGFSKDFRPQLHQVVLGIVLDGHDRPIASFLWPGNTADVTTLLPVVERLRTRFGIRRACVVADRGMISAATIAGLEEKGIDYILGVRERSTVEVRSTVIDDDGVAVPLTIPRQKGETDLASRMSLLPGAATCWAATPNRPARTPRHVQRSEHSRNCSLTARQTRCRWPRSNQNGLDECDHTIRAAMASKRRWLAHPQQPENTAPAPL